LFAILPTGCNLVAADDSDGFPLAAIIGIAVAAALIILIIIIIIVIVVCLMKRRGKTAGDDELLFCYCFTPYRTFSIK